MLPCYVITLEDDFPNRNSLERIGLNPIAFKGVNAKKDEYLEYPKNTGAVCQYMCPKSTLSCGLSHVLLAKKLYDENVPIALVLEDDAYPKVSKLDIEQIIQDVPDDWEIIKLHCDQYCKNGSVEHTVIDGSNAAYLINRKGMYKAKNIKVEFHIDIQYSISDIKIYKSKYNLFSTDETSSTNRNITKKHWMSYLFLNPTSGEKQPFHLFLYRIFRIPSTNIEVTLGQFINFLCLLLSLYFIYVVVSSCSRLR